MTRFAKLGRVAEIVGAGKSTILAAVARGDFPKPIHTVGKKMTRWDLEEVEAHIERQRAKRDQAQAA
jgi:predicted DNA-binding transcriptional regulator AlpA